MQERPSARVFSGLTLALAAAACGPPPAEPATGQKAPGEASRPSAASPAGPARRPAGTAPRAGGWAVSYGLPSPGAAETGASPEWAGCGLPDAALAGAAALGAERLAHGEPLPDADALTFEVRRRGGAFVGLRWWSRAGADADADAAALEAWAATRPPAGQRYCGVARVTAPRSAVVAVSADAVSTLAPLPSTLSVGEWVDVTGALVGEARGVRLVVLDPAGPPRSVTAQREGARWRFRAAPRSPGPWLLQVVVEGQRGPLPALEALVHVGTPPPASVEALVAAGEEAALGSVDEADALARMASAARQGERLSPLTRDAHLDALAVAHARAQRDAGVLGHDVGQGDPSARAEAAGVTGAVGENVARARSPVGVHRAWWRSPSHRGNLLDPRFRRAGVGTARGADGALWAVLTLGE